jgi:signal transduction histidine kinase
VAAGTSPQELFAAVAEEVGRLLAVSSAVVGRYEPDDTVTSVAAWGMAAGCPIGSRWAAGVQNLTTIVFETGRPARIDDFADTSGPIGDAARETGCRSAVATPITVEGRIWGVVVAETFAGLPLPADTEARLSNFTKLVATAIANAESRVELMASRARTVAASDEARRRIERDLHDGTQQRLVSLGLELRAVQAAVPPQLDELKAALARVVGELASVFHDLREISHGIHPVLLSEGGLETALRALRRRSAVPLELDLHSGRRLPQPVEVATYYVVSEALSNAAKHAHATVVNVELHIRGAIMQLAIRDDGIGGAKPRRGTGLLGLRDRIEALGGTLQVTSPIGKGTTLLIEIPLEDQTQALSPAR